MNREMEQFKDKLLPDQPLLRMYFDGDETQYAAALYDTLLAYNVIELPETKFDLAEPDGFPLASMVSNLTLLKLMRLLIMIKKPQRILEVGTFVGVSAIYMATAMPPEGKIITIEKYDRFAEVARENIARNNFDDKIQLICGDAFEVLNKTEFSSSFDLIFLDGNKEKYADYFDLLDPLLKPGGLMIVDDVFFQGDVLNPSPRTEKGLGACRFLYQSTSHDGYFNTVLPLGDGVSILLKKV